MKQDKWQKRNVYVGMQSKFTLYTPRNKFVQSLSQHIKVNSPHTIQNTLHNSLWSRHFLLFPRKKNRRDYNHFKDFVLKTYFSLFVEICQKPALNVTDTILTNPLHNLYVHYFILYVFTASSRARRNMLISC